MSRLLPFDKCHALIGSQEVDIQEFFQYEFKEAIPYALVLTVNTYYILKSASEEFNDPHHVKTCSCTNPRTCSANCGRAWIKSILHPIEEDQLTTKEQEKLRWVDRSNPAHIYDGIYCFNVDQNISVFMYVSEHYTKFNIFSIRR